MLPPSAWDEWLDPDNRDVEGLARLLVPAPEELLVPRPVSQAVSDVRNNGPELIEETPRAQDGSPDGDEGNGQLTLL